MMIDHKITEGLTSVYTQSTVTSNGALALHTGALDYLVSTPAVATMVIDASTGMLDKLLPSDYITVGKKIELYHEHPSLLGESITVKLKVEKVEAHSVILDVQVTDSKGLVCHGKHERSIISKTKLLDIAYQRAPGLI